MQTVPRNTPALLSRLGAVLGGLGFLLSFALAVTLLARQGSPGFLLLWTAASLAAIAAMRAHRQWRKTIERMYAPDAIRIFYPARKEWRNNVEDVAFRDFADASVLFSQ